MSCRFASEQLAADHPLNLLVVEDADAAKRSPARLLITASTQQSVETLARRIHGSGPRAQFPFVVAAAADLPVGAQALRADCVRLLDAAAAGSVLVLAGLESARGPSAAVRLISGTTVPLLDRVAAGTFSERLFCRLNIIHLMVGNGFSSAALI